MEKHAWKAKQRGGRENETGHEGKIARSKRNKEREREKARVVKN